jgi:hypothetical protein
MTPVASIWPPPRGLQANDWSTGFRKRISMPIVREVWIVKRKRLCSFLPAELVRHRAGSEWTATEFECRRSHFRTNSLDPSPQLDPKILFVRSLSYQNAPVRTIARIHSLEYNQNNHQVALIRSEKLPIFPDTDIAAPATHLALALSRAARLIFHQTSFCSPCQSSIHSTPRPRPPPRCQSRARRPVKPATAPHPFISTSSPSRGHRTDDENLPAEHRV